MEDVFGWKALSQPKRVLKILSGDNSEFPATVHIGPMAGCNHACVWCSDIEYRKKYAGYLDADKFKPILKEFAENGVDSVVWIGSGEPTYHPRFSEMVEYAHEVGLLQGCVTNGSKFPVEHVQKFEWIRFSVDAGKADTHKLLHVVKDYDRVRENIRLAAASEGETVIGISYLVCDDNAEELPEFIRTLDEWKVDYIQVKRLASTPQYEALPVSIETGFATDHIKVIDDVAAEQGGNAGLPCWSSSLNAVIAPTGEVMLCCRLSNTGRDEDAAMGNIFAEGSFGAVWNGDRRREVVERFRRVEETAACPTCWMTQINVQIDKLQGNRHALKSLLFV